MKPTTIPRDHYSAFRAQGFSAVDAAGMARNVAQVRAFMYDADDHDAEDGSRVFVKLDESGDIIRVTIAPDYDLAAPDGDCYDAEDFASFGETWGYYMAEVEVTLADGRTGRDTLDVVDAGDRWTETSRLDVAGQVLSSVLHHDMIGEAREVAERMPAPQVTRAQEALTAYWIAREGRTFDPGETEDTVTDLVTDLRHLVGFLGLDWTTILDRAELHHDAERPRAKEDGREPSHYFAEGWSVAMYDTDPPSELDDLDDDDRAEYDRGYESAMEVRHAREPHVDSDTPNAHPCSMCSGWINSEHPDDCLMCAAGEGSIHTYEPPAKD